MNDDELLRSLEYGRPAEMRILAAQALSGRTSPAVIGGLTRGLGDPTPEVRVAVAQALASSSANLLRGAAETLLNDSAVPAVSGVELLGSMMSAAGLALWQSITDSGDPKARTRAAEIILGMPHEQTLAFLRDALDADGPEAVTAACVLAPLGDDRATDLLFFTIADDAASDEARRFCARAMLDCRTPTTSHAVAEVLRDDRLVLAWHSEDSVATADLVDDAVASDYAPLRSAGSAALDLIVGHIEQTHDDDLEHALGALISVADHDARVRGGQAILALGADETLDALAELVDEHFDDPAVQLAEVASILGEFVGQGALPILLRLAVHGDWYTGQFAIQSIGKGGDPAAAPLLYKIASDEEARPELRRAALLAIARLRPQDGGVLEALLICVLGDPGDSVGPDEPIYRLAGRVLAEFKLSEAVDPLRDALADDRPAVRRSAAWALGELAAVESLSDLITLLEHDDEVVVRQASAWALGRLGATDESVSALSAALGDEPPVCDQAALSLGMLRVEDAGQALRLALDKPQPGYVQDRLVWALGELKDEAAVAELLRLLVAGESVVRRRSAEALGRIGASAAGPDLCKRVGVETDPEVRTAVIHALGELAWVDAKRSLERAARDTQSPAVRRAAVQVLGRIGDDDSLRLLQTIAHADRDVTVSDAARAAMARLLDQHALRDDSDWDDGEAAA